MEYGFLPGLTQWSSFAEGQSGAVYLWKARSPKVKTPFQGRRHRKN
jgi:hypothetical protein